MFPFDRYIMQGMLNTGFTVYRIYKMFKEMRTP